jgi:hypothetical protein
VSFKLSYTAQTLAVKEPEKTVRILRLMSYYILGMQQILKKIWIWRQIFVTWIRIWICL